MESSALSYSRTDRLLSLCTLLLCLAVVVLGAYVRISDAGLGCPDWPGCYGSLTVPSSADDVARADVAYPERPLEAAKAWKEMLHRYAASTLGLLIFVIWVRALRRNDGRRPYLEHVLLLLVIFQGMLGMWTVTWLLQPMIVSAHLLGGMTTLAALAWLALRSFRLAEAVPWRRPKLVKVFALLALAMLVVQVSLGAWTSATYSAYACPDFPTCQGKYWPDLAPAKAFEFEHSPGTNYEFGVMDLDGRVTVHFAHRLGALLTLFVLLDLVVILFVVEGSRKARILATKLVLALGLQLAIGVALVLTGFGTGLATAHNAGAALLLLVMVAILRAAFCGHPTANSATVAHAAGDPTSDPTSDPVGVPIDGVVPPTNR